MLWSAFFVFGRRFHSKKRCLGNEQHLVRKHDRSVSFMPEWLIILKILYYNALVLLGLDDFAMMTLVIKVFGGRWKDRIHKTRK